MKKQFFCAFLMLLGLASFNQRVMAADPAPPSLSLLPAAASEADLQAGGDFYVLNVGSGKFLTRTVDGDNYGTRSSVANFISTAKSSFASDSYKFTVAYTADNGYTLYSMGINGSNQAKNGYLFATDANAWVDQGSVNAAAYWSIAPIADGAFSIKSRNVFKTEGEANLFYAPQSDKHYALCYANSNDTMYASFIDWKFYKANECAAYVDAVKNYELEVYEKPKLASAIVKAEKLLTERTDATLAAAVQTAKDAIADNAIAAFKAQTNAVYTAISAYLSNLTTIYPGATAKEIVNASLNTNRDGWIANPSDAAGGTGVAEFYQKNNVTFSQVIANCEPGYYKLIVQGFFRTGANTQASQNTWATDAITANLYATVDTTTLSTPLTSVYSIPSSTSLNGQLYGFTNNVAGGKTLLDGGYYPVEFNFTVENQGDVTIGVASGPTASLRWICFNNFKLVRLGDVPTTATAEQLGTLATLLPSATNLQSQKMLSTVKSALDLAIAAAEAIDNTSSRVDAQNAIDGLTAAITPATASANAYTSLNTAIANMSAFSAYPGYAALQTAVTVAEGVYNNATLDLEGITQALAELKVAERACRLTEATPANFTWLMANPNFETFTGDRDQSISGWTKTGTNDTEFCIRTNNDGPAGKTGTGYFQHWSPSKPDFSISQTLRNIPNGTYKITAFAGGDTGTSGTYLYANDSVLSVTEAKDYEITVEVANDSLTIGFKSVSRTVNWAFADNFRLTFVGAPVEPTPTSYLPAPATEADLQAGGQFYVMNVRNGKFLTRTLGNNNYGTRSATAGYATANKTGLANDQYLFTVAYDADNAFYTFHSNGVNRDGAVANGFMFSDGNATWMDGATNEKGKYTLSATANSAFTIKSKFSFADNPDVFLAPQDTVDFVLTWTDTKASTHEAFTHWQFFKAEDCAAFIAATAADEFETFSKPRIEYAIAKAEKLIAEQADVTLAAAVDAAKAATATDCRALNYALLSAINTYLNTTLVAEYGATEVTLATPDMTAATGWTNGGTIANGIGEFYQANNKVTYQTVSCLAGSYKLIAQAAFRTKASSYADIAAWDVTPVGAFMYATAGSSTTSETLPSLYSIPSNYTMKTGSSYGANGYTDNQVTANAVFANGYYPVEFNFVILDDADVTIGMNSGPNPVNNGRWVAFDNFKLIRTGEVPVNATSDQLNSIATLVTSANTLKDKAMQLTQKDSILIPAITSAEAITSANTVAEARDAITELTAAIASATISADAYSAMNAAIQFADTAKFAYASYPGYEVYAEAISEAESMYVAATADAEAMTAALAQLKVAEKACRLTQATPANFTWLIVNPDMQASPATTGWSKDGTITNFAALTVNNWIGMEGTALETWSDQSAAPLSRKVFQIIEDAPNGAYKLTAAAFANYQKANAGTDTTGVSIYANEYKVGVPVTYNVSTSAVYELEFEVTDNTIELGMKLEDAYANWCAMDNFSLTYLGEAEHPEPSVLDLLPAPATEADLQAGGDFYVLNVGSGKFLTRTIESNNYGTRSSVADYLSTDKSSRASDSYIFTIAYNADNGYTFFSNGINDAQKAKNGYLFADNGNAWVDQATLAANGYWNITATQGDAFSIKSRAEYADSTDWVYAPKSADQYALCFSNASRTEFAEFVDWQFYKASECTDFIDAVKAIEQNTYEKPRLEFAIAKAEKLLAEANDTTLRETVLMAQDAIINSTGYEYKALTNAVYKAISVYLSNLTTIYSEATEATIVNPTLNENRDGWVVNPSDAAGGTGVTEFYQKDNATFSQVIADCEPGQYKLIVQGYFRSGANTLAAQNAWAAEDIAASLYATVDGSTSSTPLASIYSIASSSTLTGNMYGFTNNVTGGKTLLDGGYYPVEFNFTVNSKSDVTIGVSSGPTATLRWICFNNFKLVRLGEVPSTATTEQLNALATLLTSATNLQSKKMQNTVKSALDPAITTAQGIDKTSAGTDAQAAIDTLSAAVNTATTSVNAYAALNTAITAANDSAYVSYPGYAEYVEAITAANAIYAAATADAEAVTVAVAALKAAEKACRLTQSAPADFTWLMANPNFETFTGDRDQSISGWTKTGTAGSEYCIRTDAGPAGKTGTGYFQNWGGSNPDFSISQTLTDVPNGLYKIVAFAGGNAGTSGTFLYANDEELAVTTDKDHEITVNVIDGNLTIGFKSVNRTVNWAYADNFRLTYLGNETAGAELIAELTALMNKAITLVTQDISPAAEALLDEVEEQEAYEADVTPISTVLEAIETMKAAIETYRSAYIKNYSFEDSADAWTEGVGTVANWTRSTTEGYNWSGCNDAWKTDGNRSFGIWKPAIDSDFELSQVITDLPNGTYKITVDMTVSKLWDGTSRVNGQRLFAGDQEDLYPVEAETTLDNGDAYTLVVQAIVTDGTLKLGIRTDGGTANGTGWFKVDNFSIKQLNDVIDSTPEIDASGNGIIIVNVSGGIEITVAQPQLIQIHTIGGQLVKAIQVTEGTTVIDLPSGSYIVAGQSVLVD